MRALILLPLILMLSGCPKDTPPPRTDTTVGPTVTLPAKTAEQIKVESLQEQLKAAEKAEADAAAEGKTTARLVAENRQLQLRTQIAEEQQAQLNQYLDSLHRQQVVSDKAVEASKVNDWQWRLYYVAMALTALGVLAFIGVRLYPLVATLAGGAWKIFAALAVAVTVIAKLLPQIVWFIDFIPYLLWPIGIIIVLYGIVVFRHWWLDQHTAKQFTALVPKLKALGINIEQHMQNELDSPVLAHIETISKKLAAEVKVAPVVGKTMDILNPTKPA